MDPFGVLGVYEWVILNIQASGFCSTEWAKIKIAGHSIRNVPI
jgi:hypothetical protein